MFLAHVYKWCKKNTRQVAKGTTPAKNQNGTWQSPLWKGNSFSWNVHFWVPAAFWRCTYFWALSTIKIYIHLSFRSCEVSTSNLEKYCNWYHSWSPQKQQLFQFHSGKQWSHFRVNILQGSTVYCSGSFVVRSTDWGVTSVLFSSLFFATTEKKTAQLNHPKALKKHGDPM